MPTNIIDAVDEGGDIRFPNVDGSKTITVTSFDSTHFSSEPFNAAPIECEDTRNDPEKRCFVPMSRQEFLALLRFSRLPAVIWPWRCMCECVRVVYFGPKASVQHV